jgi:hypothetical protein
MRPENSTKMFVFDDEGTAIAYTRDGTVFDCASGARIAKLQAGQLYSFDGQLLGTRLPSGKVRGVNGQSAAFMTLFQRV